tara:strand:- start:50 stop:3103 length:3054 start_codon:yes stop_codon:yes gene_type:complete
MSIYDNENSDNNSQDVPTPVDPCEDLPPPPPPPPPGGGGEDPTSGEGGPGILLPPFLSPINTIDQELIGAIREINIFNKNLFIDLGSGQLAEQNPDVPTDRVRALFNKVWTVAHSGRDMYEVFFSDIATQTTPIGYNILEDTFDFSSKHWSGKLKIFFPSSMPPETLSLINEMTGADDPTSITKFVDTNFAAAQPFHEKELDNIRVNNSTSVTINSHVGYYEETPHKIEPQMPNLYRSYFKALRNVHEVCDVDDRVQKFTSDNVSQMKDANETLKRYFNQYVEISINTQQSGKISTLLDEFQMDKYVLELASSIYAKPIEYSQVEDESRVTGSDLDEYLANDKVSPSAVSITSPDPFRNLISTLKDRNLEFFEKINHSSYPLKFEYWNDPTALRFTDTIRSQILMNNIEDQVMTPENLRSLTGIFTGRKAHSEMVGYRIAKHEVVDDVFNPEPIQNFYFMDSDKVLSIDFVDSQVNAGKTYVYRIYSLNLVMGSRYRYSPDGPWSFERLSAAREFNVRIEPSIKIIEAPFFQKVVSVTEKPPLAPQASFIPLQGVDNQMQIIVRSNFGETSAKPLEILESDRSLIESMIQAQPLSEDGVLEYRTDSLPEGFQVMRLSTAPERYEDFSGADYITTVPARSRAVIFKDEDFEPNKDYFYCFRTFDKVGVSNPSSVFKLRLNSYANGIFMQLDEYTMVPKVFNTPSIVFERALKITPSFSQTAISASAEINMESREFVTSVPRSEDISIGSVPDEDYIWGRSFKMRLVSKSTNRKIDLNVTFNREVIEVRPEDPPVATETVPCGPTDLDIAIGNDGGDNVIDEGQLVLETEDPIPLDPQVPVDPDGPGVAEARRNLELAAVGTEFLDAVGVASVDEYLAGEGLEGFIGGALEGRGTASGNVSPAGAAVGVGSTTDGDGSYTAPTSEPMQSGMAGGGDDDDRSGNSGSSGGDGEAEVGDDVFEDDVEGFGMAGGPTNNLNNSNATNMPVFKGVVRATGVNVNVSGNNYNNEAPDDIELPDR